jgi:hypothetical protein
LTNQLKLFGVAWNKPRSHTIETECKRKLDHPVSAGTSVCSMAAGQLYQTKSVAYLFGFVYFFREFVTFRFVSAH